MAATCKKMTVEMKKYLLIFGRNAAIFFGVCFVFDYFFFDVRSVLEYLIQTLFFAIAMAYLDWRKDRNRQKQRITETEEEKAILDSLREQIKPFKTENPGQGK